MKIFENFITEKKDESFVLSIDNELNRLGYSTFYSSDKSVTFTMYIKENYCLLWS